MQRCAVVCRHGAALWGDAGLLSVCRVASAAQWTVDGCCGGVTLRCGSRWASLWAWWLHVQQLATIRILNTLLTFSKPRVQPPPVPVRPRACCVLHPWLLQPTTLQLLSRALMVCRGADGRELRHRLEVGCGSTLREAACR